MDKDIQDMLKWKIKQFDEIDKLLEEYKLVGESSVEAVRRLLGLPTLKNGGY